MKNKAELTKMAEKSFHFALKPSILPPDGPIYELLQNLSYKYSKDAACYSVHEEQESHAVAGKPRDAAVNSDRYQQPVGQKQSECETENVT